MTDACHPKGNLLLLVLHMCVLQVDFQLVRPHGTQAGYAAMNHCATWASFCSYTQRIICYHDRCLPLERQLDLHTCLLQVEFQLVRR
jgi:hypothetical protein